MDPNQSQNQQQQQHQKHQQQQQHHQHRPAVGHDHGINAAIVNYPYLQHPTDDNLGQWAAVTAPLVTGHQAAALIHHTVNHATGISNHLASQGVTPTARQGLVQSHLAFLRNQWPHGQWYPPTCTPTTDPPPLDVLTPMKSLTEYWMRHVGSRPLSDLWAHHGIMWQVVEDTRSPRLTRRVAQAALRRVKELFPVPAPVPRSVPPTLRSPRKPESEPETPLFAFPVPTDDLAPSPLRQTKSELDDDDGFFISLEPEINREASLSPPPMPEDDDSDVSLDGVLSDLFAQPGIPLAPTSKKFKRIREVGLAAAEQKKYKGDTAACRRRPAEAVASVGDEGLDDDKIDEVARVLADAAAQAVSRAAKRHYAHMLSPGQRAVIIKRSRRKIEEMVSDYL